MPVVDRNTITDEQIRTLQVEARLTGDTLLGELCRITLCAVDTEGHRRARRARCADAWNTDPDRLTGETITDDDLERWRAGQSERADLALAVIALNRFGVNSSATTIAARRARTRARQEGK